MTETPPMFLSEKQMDLLVVAESLIYSGDCENHCIYFKEGIFPGECSRFECDDGYLVCRNYEQEGGADA